MIAGFSTALPRTFWPSRETAASTGAKATTKCTRPTTTSGWEPPPTARTGFTTSIPIRGSGACMVDGNMIEYDRYDWVNTVFSFRGTALRYARGKFGGCSALTLFRRPRTIGPRDGRDARVASLPRPPLRSRSDGTCRARLAAGFPDRLPHECFEQPLLGGAVAVGANPQCCAQSGARRRRVLRRGSSLADLVSAYADLLLRRSLQGNLDAEGKQRCSCPMSCAAR